ncbi:HD domain-containing protein [candidate division FCPU426 bacterium]|nr:HD domain-containing protein [candidate division FCPU426 bacterium]
MFGKPLLEKLFDAAYMQRWNDKARPVELTELDKQAHKMVIAYLLGKLSEHEKGFDWAEVIEGGIFEFLQRVVLTDLKPPIFHKIKADAEKYKRLNAWVFRELQPVITPLGPEFTGRFQRYFTQPEENINRQTLNAAHFYATKWEFDIIQKSNPNSYDIDEIRADLESKQNKYRSLASIQQLESDKRLVRFINLCGELRFQIRWSNLHRIPKTSVLGHMLFVAVTAYLFSLAIGACRKRSLNNFLTGLFHDLPEVLTRDIISPVKRAVEGLSDLIKEYEAELMEKEVYSLLPDSWHNDMRMYTEREFENIVWADNRRLRPTCAEISAHYNQDAFNPRDGELVKAADMLAAFMEAHAGILNGSASQDLHEARKNIKYLYQSEIKNIGGIDFGRLYFDFE